MAELTQEQWDPIAAGILDAFYAEHAVWRLHMAEARENVSPLIAAMLADAHEAGKREGAAEALLSAADRVAIELGNEIHGHTSTASVRRWLRERAALDPNGGE